MTIQKPLGPGEVRWLQVTALACRCARCEAEFIVIAERVGEDPPLPARCRACRTPYWRVPRGTLRRGRPALFASATCVRCTRGFSVRSSEARTRPEGWRLEALCPECQERA
jgi:hypothetical protein